MRFATCSGGKTLGKAICFLFLWFPLLVVTPQEQGLLLPFFNSLDDKFLPAGEKAWLPTGYIEFENKIISSDISRDGNLLVIGDDEGCVELFDLARFRSLWRTQVYTEEHIPVDLVKLDPTGNLVAVSAGRYPNRALPIFLLDTGSGDIVLESPAEKDPNPACALQGNMLDPIASVWSPDGSTLYTLYDSHQAVNRGDCFVPEEKYCYVRNVRTGIVDIKKVSVEPFEKPEGDEPGGIWVTGEQHLALSVDGKTIAIASANSRICTYDTNANRKLTLKRISRSLYYWTDEFGFSSSNDGHMIFDRSGNIYALIGEPAGMADTYLVRLSGDLSCMEMMAKVNEPKPIVRLSGNEKILMIAGESINLWDLTARKSLYHGPYGLVDGYNSLIHPKKRLVLMAVGKRFYMLVERPAVKLRLGANWTGTGRIVCHFDSVYIRGKGKIGVGYGDWLREDWFTDEAFFNDSYSIRFPNDDDFNEEGELSFRTKNPGEFILYGGRSKEEGTSVKKIYDLLPLW